MRGGEGATRSPALRRLLAPPRRKPAVETFIPRCHVDEQLRRRKTRTMLRGKPLAQRHKALRSHHVDIGQGAARKWREAETQDRADIGLAYVGEHVFLEAARGLQRLDAEQAIFY